MLCAIEIDVLNLTSSRYDNSTGGKMSVPLIGKYSKKKLAVTDLLLDLSNFRTGTVSDQTSAISALINSNANKIKGLVTNISENGFLDLDIPCVFPDPTNSGKYIVGEGNRRISSLKMLKTPALAKNTPLMEYIKKIKSRSTKKIPSKIECAIFESKKDCLGYILMRHGYSPDGSGVVQWNSIAKLRADTFVNGTIHQELRVLEYVVERGSLSEKHLKKIDSDEINITNLERLTDDKQVRSILGITGTNCLISSFGEQWLLRIWQNVIEVIIDAQHRGTKFTVDNNINSTKQRQKFITEIIEDVGKQYGDLKNADNQKCERADLSGKPNPVAAGSEPDTASTHPSQKTKTQTTSARKGLIPRKFNPAGLKPQKAVNICDELKKMDVDAFPNSVGAMFRIFIELGIDDFLKTHPTIRYKNDRLASKITAIAKHMEDESILTKKELKPIRDIISNPRYPISTDTLNAYVHNPHVSPNADELKTGWDNIQHFMEEIWK